MANSWLCVDASVVVRLVLSGDEESPLVALWQQWHEAGHTLAAPTLLYYEVSNALHRYAALGELIPQEVDDALAAALDLDIALFGDADLHRRALMLARRLSLPAVYDAHYLALAERTGAAFWTADKRLAAAVQPALSWVKQLPI